MEPMSRLQAMQKIGKWLSQGVTKDSALDKKITRMCGSLGSGRIADRNTFRLANMAEANR